MTASKKTSTPVFNRSWQIVCGDIEPGQGLLKESIFSLANGYIGTRGTLEGGAEGPDGNAKSDRCEGTYLNGLFYQEQIPYGEISFGNATHNDRMLQVPDGKELTLSLDGQPFYPTEDTERVFDMGSAVLTCKQRMTTNDGQSLMLVSRRFVSLSNQHLIAIEYQLTPLNFSGAVHLQSSLDAGYQSIHVDDDPRAGELDIKCSLTLIEQQQSQAQILMLHQIKGQQTHVCSVLDHRSPDSLLKPVDSQVSGDKTLLTLEINLIEEQASTIEKYIGYSHQHLDQVTDTEHLSAIASCQEQIKQARQLGFDALFHQHQSVVSQFWQDSDIEISGDPLLQQGIRFNLLHLFMSVGKDGHSNIGAKGLTGPGYDGHYFWDSEIYILPFLIYTNPELAKNLLSFRYNTLDKARARARSLAHNTGALYPWRTIGGDECSAFFPAGTAQYHINAAIAYGIRSYYYATDDWQFMLEQGAEMLFETARIWAQMGHFSKQHQGQFCIHEVTGPDEYTAMVNNNFYTNAMAKLHLGFAVEIAQLMQQRSSNDYADLINKIGLSDAELTQWQHAAQAMYLPYDEQLGVNPQDDSFLSKPTWDTANTPADKYPLLIHFHPLVIYRHQVLKQADVVLAMFLLDDQFDLDVKKRNLDYYEPLTTHDSTLSACIHSIEYAETGDYQRAYEFFEQTVRMDLDNHHGNSGYGLHTACMAGSWLSIVQGFAGMRVRDNQLHFNPVLPAQWQETTIKLCFRGRRLSITLTPTGTRYQLLSGEPLTIFEGEQQLSLSCDQTETTGVI